MSILKTYERMQKEGKLSKPIKIQQPTPDNPDGNAFGDTGDYKGGIKKMMNEKTVVPETNLSTKKEIRSLKNRVKFLEETLELIMKQHVELMRD